MMSKTMERALNEQMNKELASAYIYAAMAADFSVKNYNGCARWMTLQAKEEMGHAEKIYHFILERGGRPLYDAISRPQESWENIKQVFEHALQHEQFISKSIDELVNTARKEDDKAAEIFLQWFVSEQVEEEATVEGVLATLDMVGTTAQGLFMFDRQMGARE